MTNADECNDASGDSSFRWGPLLQELTDSDHAEDEDEAPSSPWKTILDSLCWLACIFASVTASLPVLMIWLIGNPSYHPGIFALGCLSVLFGFGSSFGILASSPGRGIWWLLPSAILFGLAWRAFSLPGTHDFIH